MLRLNLIIMRLLLYLALPNIFLCQTLNLPHGMQRLLGKQEDQIAGNIFTGRKNNNNLKADNHNEPFKISVLNPSYPKVVSNKQHGKISDDESYQDTHETLVLSDTFFINKTIYKNNASTNNRAIESPLWEIEANTSKTIDENLYKEENDEQLFIDTDINSPVVQFVPVVDTRNDTENIFNIVSIPELSSVIETESKENETHSSKNRVNTKVAVDSELHNPKYTVNKFTKTTGISTNTTTDKYSEAESPKPNNAVKDFVIKTSLVTKNTTKFTIIKSVPQFADTKNSSEEEETKHSSNIKSNKTNQHTLDELHTEVENKKKNSPLIEKASQNIKESQESEKELDKLDLLSNIANVKYRNGSSSQLTYNGKFETVSQEPYMDINSLQIKTPLDIPLATEASFFGAGSPSDKLKIKPYLKESDEPTQVLASVSKNKDKRPPISLDLFKLEPHKFNFALENLYKPNINSDETSVPLKESSMNTSETTNNKLIPASETASIDVAKLTAPEKIETNSQSYKLSLQNLKNYLNLNTEESLVNLLKNNAQKIMSQSSKETPQNAQQLKQNILSLLGSETEQLNYAKPDKPVKNTLKLPENSGTSFVSNKKGLRKNLNKPIIKVEHPGNILNYISTKTGNNPADMSKDESSLIEALSSLIESKQKTLGLSGNTTDYFSSHKNILNYLVKSVKTTDAGAIQCLLENFLKKRKMTPQVLKLKDNLNKLAGGKITLLENGMANADTQIKPPKSKKPHLTNVYENDYFKALIDLFLEYATEKVFSRGYFELEMTPKLNRIMHESGVLRTTELGVDIQSYLTYLQKKAQKINNKNDRRNNVAFVGLDNLRRVGNILIKTKKGSVRKTLEFDFSIGPVKLVSVREPNLDLGFRFMTTGTAEISIVNKMGVTFLKLIDMDIQPPAPKFVILPEQLESQMKSPSVVILSALNKFKYDYILSNAMSSVLKQDNIYTAFTAIREFLPKGIKSDRSLGRMKQYQRSLPGLSSDYFRGI